MGVEEVVGILDVVLLYVVGVVGVGVVCEDVVVGEGGLGYWGF